MSTIYLKFPDKDTAETFLLQFEAELSEFGDHFSNFFGGWGTLFPIAGQEGHFANVYDFRGDSTHESLLEMYRIPDPKNPMNVRA